MHWKVNDVLLSHDLHDKSMWCVHGVVKTAHNIILQVSDQEQNMFALKMPFKTGKEALRELENEARHFLSVARHGNILETFGIASFRPATATDRSQDSHALKLEWMAQGSLRDVLIEPHKHFAGNNPEKDNDNKLRIVWGIAAGLSHLEAQIPKFSHGDIKPENILVSAEYTAKIADFGESQSSIGLGGARKFTPEYAAPELFKGGKPSIRSDIYSFGLVCMEVATGRHPFEEWNGGAAGAGLEFAHHLVKPGMNHRFWANYPWLLPIVERCVQKDAGARYGTFAEVFKEFTEHAGGVEGPPKPEESQRDHFGAALNAAEAFYKLGLFDQAKRKYIAAARLDPHYVKSVAVVNPRQTSAANAQFSGSSFSDCDFRNTFFGSLTANGGSWETTNMSGCLFGQSLVKNVRMDRVNMAFTDLRGSDFSGCDLSRVILAGAAYNESTKLPRNLDPEAEGLSFLPGSTPYPLPARKSGMLQDFLRDLADFSPEEPEPWRKLRAKYPQLLEHDYQPLLEAGLHPDSIPNFRLAYRRFVDPGFEQRMQDVMRHIHSFLEDAEKLGVDPLDAVRSYPFGAAIVKKCPYALQYLFRRELEEECAGCDVEWMALQLQGLVGMLETCSMFFAAHQIHNASSLASLDACISENEALLDVDLLEKMRAEIPFDTADSRADFHAKLAFLDGKSVQHYLALLSSSSQSGKDILWKTTQVYPYMAGDRMRHLVAAMQAENGDANLKMRHQTLSAYLSRKLSR